MSSATLPTPIYWMQVAVFAILTLGTAIDYLSRVVPWYARATRDYPNALEEGGIMPHYIAYGMVAAPLLLFLIHALRLLIWLPPFVVAVLQGIAAAIFISGILGIAHLYNKYRYAARTRNSLP